MTTKISEVTEPVKQKGYEIVDAGSNGNSWSNINVSFQIKEVGTAIGYPIGTFSMNGCASGCGLGILGGWVYCMAVVKKNDNLRNIIVEHIKNVAKRRQWSCLIVSLGETYLKRSGKSEYEEFIESMGFKEVHTFMNLQHSTTHRQKIYVIDSHNLK